MISQIYRYTFTTFVISICLTSGILGQRRVSEEALLFQKVRDGVFTIFGDRGHGSGFLIDSRGIVLTNQHIIDRSKYIRVLINDTLKVDAKLLVEDKERDIAALRINSKVCSSLPIIQISKDTDKLVFEGEKVIAIGSPLNQTKIMTLGIVSKVEEKAIISDVNINPGNSGGPLINMDGNVIGINTFGDISDRGPGVSGIVKITEAGGVITKSTALLESTEEPQMTSLPIIPEGMFPISSLRLVASKEKIDTKPYYVSELTSTGDFIVQCFTPPYLFWLRNNLTSRLAKERQKREKKGGVSADEAYDPLSYLKEWFQYVGENKPVVVFRVTPKIGQTTGSKVANILGAFSAGLSGTYYRGNYKYEYKGDLYDFSLKRNGNEVTEYRRSFMMQPSVFHTADWTANYNMEDLAQSGILYYSHETFKPTGTQWPDITLAIYSVEKPDEPKIVNLPRQTVEQIWSDFEPYREDVKRKTIGLEVSK